MGFIGFSKLFLTDHILFSGFTLSSFMRFFWESQFFNFEFCVEKCKFFLHVARIIVKISSDKCCVHVLAMVALSSEGYTLVKNFRW
jgi:hypothetical protein